MNINMQRDPSDAVKEFRIKLEGPLRADMDATRKSMTDVEFAKIYGVSSMTIVNYMGFKKRFENAALRFDIDEINKLRFTMDDIDIAKMYDCSLSTIHKRCGKKTVLGIPRKKTVYKSESVATINRRLELENRVIRKQDNWVYKVEKPYWEVENEVQLFQGPHKFLYQKLG